MSAIRSDVLGPVLSLKRLPHGEGLDLPAYETAGAAGMDLRAAVTTGTDDACAGCEGAGAHRLHHGNP